MLADALSDWTLGGMVKLDLDVVVPKCQNFLVEGGGEGKLRIDTDKDKRNEERKSKELKKFKMNATLDALEDEAAEGKGKELPLRWVYSSKLLGIILDGNWNFGGQLSKMRSKIATILQVLAKVGNTMWELESRILSIMTHALIESIVCYGLATTGSRWTVKDASIADMGGP